MFDFRVVTQWVDATLHQYLPASLVTTTEFVLVGVCLLVAYAVMALGLIYAERKVCAFFQCRLGPNRVGPFGMIQTVTDMIKMLIKEIIEINHVDRFLFNLAPYIVIIASLLAFSCIPFAKGLEIIDFNVGIFFLIAVSSIGIVGILLAGWAVTTNLPDRGQRSEPDDQLRVIDRVIDPDDGSAYRQHAALDDCRKPGRRLVYL